MDRHGGSAPGILGLMEDREAQKVIVEGLAALTISLVSMGSSADETRAQLMGWAAQLGVADDPRAFRSAAACVRSGPHPLQESAEETERARPIREMLGVPSAEDDLLAEMTAAETLEEIAAAIDATR